MLGMQELGLFGWIKKGNSFIQPVHSSTHISGLEASNDLRRQGIGFIGDRDVYGNQPHPVKMPKKNMWEWPNITCAMDGLQMASFYGDEDKCLDDWVPLDKPFCRQQEKYQG